jgi:hypothetical protein
LNIRVDISIKSFLKNSHIGAKADYWLVWGRYICTWFWDLYGPGMKLVSTSGYPWRSDTIRPCLQARVAAFGFQDLGSRTLIFGSQDLGFRTSINGHWVSGLWQTHAFSGLGFQDLDGRTKALHPMVVDRCSVLCISRHFSLRPVVTDRQTHRRTQQGTL